MNINTKYIIFQGPLFIHFFSLWSIVQSVYDGLVDLSHAHHAKEHIRGAALCLLHSWGHLIWLGKEAAETDSILLGFLES